MLSWTLSWKLVTATHGSNVVALNAVQLISSESWPIPVMEMESHVNLWLQPWLVMCLKSFKVSYHILKFTISSFMGSVTWSATPFICEFQVANFGSQCRCEAVSTVTIRLWNMHINWMLAYVALWPICYGLLSQLKFIGWMDSTVHCKLPVCNTFKHNLCVHSSRDGKAPVLHLIP